MAEYNECLDSFGIDDLLDFSNEEIAAAIDGGGEEEEDMQQQSADSSVTAENFSSKQQQQVAAAAAPPKAAMIKPPVISLIDRDFTVPAPAVDLEWLISGFGSEESCYGSSSSNSGSKFLLGSAREEAEKENINHHHQPHQHHQQRRLGIAASPVSVLESCATSERPAMISVAGNAAAAAPAPPARSKRGRPITPSTRIFLSSSGSCADDEYEEEEYEEEEEEEEASEEEAFSEEEEEEDGSMESDCALSTESEVVTEDDFRPAKRPCYNKSAAAAAAVKGWGNPVRVGHQQVVRGGGGCQVAVAVAGEERRCSHCQSQKTPQWRAGPMGPKTLCNACGVRFKSGRLLPEYRPAGSPSFMLEVHSNSHRKVLEMRRQREAEVMKRLKAEAEAEAEIGEIVEA